MASIYINEQGAIWNPEFSHILIVRFYYDVMEIKTTGKIILIVTLFCELCLTYWADVHFLKSFLLVDALLD